MNCFYKYIIYFLLGIIIYSLIFKKDITEGLTREELETKIQTHKIGCHNYTCKNNEATYDNYEKKLYVGDDDYRYNNCANINDNQYIISNPDLIPCSNEICCDNHICNTNKSDVVCGGDQIFMPNKKCRYSSDPDQDDTCDENTCCQTITDTTENENWSEYLNKNCYGEDFNKRVSDSRGRADDTSFIEGEPTLQECKQICNSNVECDCIVFSGDEQTPGDCYLRKNCNIAACGSNNDFKTYIYSQGLFQDIITFRNNKGGNISNGDNITGEDIRNYLYYSLLDLVEIDVINNPLTPESRIPESNTNSFKSVSSGEEGVFIINCCCGGYNQIIYNLKYPLLGNNIATQIVVENTMDDDTCSQLSWSATTSSYPFLTDKGNLEYVDYELLSGFFSNLRDDEIDSKIILIDELENSGSIEQLPENLIALLNNIGVISNPPTKQNIKQLIINLDKILNINSVNKKPLDNFFHTTVDNHKNSLINKNIFLGLINQ